MQEEKFPYIDRLDETVLDEAILRFGTPTYVFDVEQAKKRARAFRGIIGQAADLCYAMKANPFLVRAMAEEVNRIEVCSMGEFRICKQKEIPAEKLLISGVMKDRDDLWEILETYGNRCHYTIESLNQYAILNEWARSSGKKVPVYLRLTSGNQFGMDEFDLEDAFGEQREHLCSADLREFIEKNHLDLRLDEESVFCPRDAFGSHTDSDHVYNTPRAWYIERCLNPHTFSWDGADAKYGPESDDIPWSLVPEKKLTVEDVKYVLSTHYQGTRYDPYVHSGDLSERGKYRAVGINRNDFVAVIQMRPDQPEDAAVIQWLAFASNAFNVLVPFYARVSGTPEYLSNTTKEVSTDNFYWNSRLIAAMTDASYGTSIVHVERYQLAVQSDAYAILHKYDALMEQAGDGAEREILREDANREIAEMLKKKTADTLYKVLFELSSKMKNAFSRSDN